MALLPLLPVLGPAGLTAQQDPARSPAPRADSLAADTLPADTTLTPRERALLRLRAMRGDPVQPDTTRADRARLDSLRTPGLDTLDLDTLDLDTLDLDTPGLDTLGIDRLEAGPLPVLTDPTERDRQEDPRPGRPGGGIDVDDGRIAGDSILALLRSLRGYSATEYTGEAAVFHAGTEQLELTGQARVGQGQSALSTDSLLVYDGGTGVVCGYGRPVLSGERDPIESDELCFNIERNVGVAVGARTQFQQGATWYVRGAGNRVYLLTGGEKNALYGERTEFTSCDLEHPHYTFKARSLKMVEGEMMVARNITLEFEDVPVFWLPWMVQSMKRDRRSGLLMPEFGVNDIVRNSTGYNRSISNLGFYWAINDYVSAKATFDWFSNHWTAAEGAVTYRWLRQFLNGSVNAKQYWRQREGSLGSREFTINTSNAWQPDERTRLQLNANYATSTQFVRDNSFDPMELNRKITSSASGSRSFGWGSVSAGADRSEQLSTGQVDWKLPGLSVNISPVTLFQGDEGLNLTWNANSGYTRRLRHVPDTLGTRDTETVNASYGHNLSFGRLGLSQQVRWSEDVRRGPVGSEPLPLVTGELPGPGAERVFDDALGRGFQLGEESAEALGWSTSLSYQQVLWSGTTVSPSLSISGNQVRDERTLNAFVAEPNRISTGASLNTSVYGFWPGFGRFSRIRHKIAPSARWSYSPAPEFTPLQEQVFGARNLREQNSISISFNQTFEAKVREGASPTGSDGRARTEADRAAERGIVPAGGVGEGDGRGLEPGEAGRDPEDEAEIVVRGDPSAGSGTGAPAGGGATGAQARGGRAGGARGGVDGEPARLPQAEKVLLLALDTRTSFVYDFVAAEEDGRGFLTDQISNSIRSDLLRGLQLTTTHSLFETEPVAVPGELAPRRFDPYLTRLSASFSIDDGFWLFRLLGLSSTGDGPAGPGRDAPGGPPGLEAVGEPERGGGGAESGRDQAPGMGSVIPNQGGQAGAGAGGVGRWRASLNYSLNRSRPVVGAPVRSGSSSGESQLLSGNISFQPTALWSLRWNTAYSFTDREFANHVLTLTRDLHRWQANFDFVKAQNGNFAMRFRVQLRDNPDLKLDYDQETRGAGNRPGRGAPRGVR